MSKLTILMCLICFGCSLFLCGCAKQAGSNSNVLQYQRKFENLNEKPAKAIDGIIDLSDGKKVNYDIMPGDAGMNFDIK